MKKRLDWVDIFKGLAILSVVIGHSGSFLTSYVYLFHLPAFIFISGYTFNYKKYKNFQDLVYEKFRRLIIPYFSFAFFFSFFQILLKYLRLNTVFYSTNTPEIFNPFWLFNSITSINYTNQLSGATWFLVMLFETIIFSYLLLVIQNKFRIKDFILVIFTIILLIFGCLLLYPRWPVTHVNYFLDLNFVSIVFFISGFLFKKYKIFLKVNNIFYIAVSIILILFSKMFIYRQMDFPSRTFDSWYKVLVFAFTGIILLYFISKFIEKIRLLRNVFIHIGKKTLLILCLHFFGFKIAFYILFILGLYKFKNLLLLTPPPSNFLWILIVFISLVTSIVVSKIISSNKFTRAIFLGE